MSDEIPMLRVVVPCAVIRGLCDSVPDVEEGYQIARELEAAIVDGTPVPPRTLARLALILAGASLLRATVVGRLPSPAESAEPLPDLKVDLNARCAACGHRNGGHSVFRCGVDDCPCAGYVALPAESA